MARARVLHDHRPARLDPAALDRARPGPVRARPARRRARGVLGGRAEDARAPLDGDRRDRGRRARDALQGLRLRREGGGRRDGAAPAGGRALDRDAAGRGAPGRDPLAVHALPRLPRQPRRRRRGAARARPVLGDERRRARARRPRAGGTAAVHRPRDEGSRRAARRVPAPEPAHGDGDRRVRGVRGHRHARGPARGDRRRDRGRVRPSGRVGRARRRATIRIDGTFPIDDFNEQFQRSLPDEDYHTIAGFVFGLLGHAPVEGDEVEFDGLRFQVLQVEGSRIERLEVEFLPVPDESAQPRAAEG